MDGEMAILMRKLALDLEMEMGMGMEMEMELKMKLRKKEIFHQISGASPALRGYEKPP